MNKGRTRLLAVALTSSILLGMTSCGKVDYSDKILTCADFISEYAVERKYVEIAAMSTGSDPELREFMAMSTDSATIFRPQLAIESTLQYKVLKDTLECDESDMTGTIDVEFTYCDYEEVLAAYPIFLTMEDFEEAVYSCNDQIEVTLTYEFQYIDGLVKLTNIGDLNELFPYRDIEVPLSLGFPAYVGEPQFMGSEYDAELECYHDTDSIIVDVPVEGDGQLLIWDYYFVIKNGFDTVYTSENIHDEYPSYLYLNYEFGESIPGGFYDFTLYDLEGEKFCEFSIYIIGNISPIRYIANTSLYYELPDGYGYADPNLVDMDDVFGTTQNLVDAYITSSRGRDFGYDLTIMHNPWNVTQDIIDEYMDGVYNDILEAYTEVEDIDATIHIVNYTFTIDGETYDSRTYYIETSDNYYDIYYFCSVFNYGDQTILVYCVTDSYDDLTNLLSGFHAG